MSDVNGTGDRESRNCSMPQKQPPARMAVSVRGAINSLCLNAW